MTSILTPGPEGDVFILTGYKQAQKQIKVLVENGITFVVRRDGWPVPHDLGGQTARKKSEPDFSYLKKKGR